MGGSMLLAILVLANVMLTAADSNHDGVHQHHHAKDKPHSHHSHGKHMHSDHHKGDHSHGDHMHSDHHKGDHSHGDHMHSDHHKGDHSHNDHVHSGHHKGDHSHGDHMHSDHHKGDYSHGDHMHSDHHKEDHSHGDHMHSDHHKGDHLHGDHMHSDHHKGDHSHGDHMHSAHHDNINCTDSDTNCANNHHDHHHHHHHNHHHHHQHDDDRHHHHVDIQTWYCPAGWEEYKAPEGKNSTCVFFGQKDVNFFYQGEECANYEAGSIYILDKAKNDFITGILEKNESSDTYWLYLYKDRGPSYASPLFWVGNPLNAINYFVPTSFTEQLDDVYDDAYVFLSRYGWDLSYHSYDEHKFICEKDAVCHPGWHGTACATQCHCAGEACDVSRSEPTCRYGCEKGWTGPYCSEKREAPEVRYFCINSPEENVGSYVDIYIQTKGIYYRNIHARKDDNETRSDWCSGTILTEDSDNYDHVTIKIPVNESSIEVMRQGNCAGTEVAPNSYEWNLAVQEYEGILLDTDLRVIISCDFDKSESLQRSSSFSRESADVDPETVKVSPENADVTLEVVDPFTREPISEATVGTPAKLQISYGYIEGSLVRGVHPHNCAASSSDGSQTKQLVDKNGCTSPGSPVAEFINSEGNATDLLSTDWFYIFSFEGHDSVEFRCSFDLCVDTMEGCKPGCRKHGHRHRHRREAPFARQGDVEDFSWRSSVIRILPGTHDMKNEGGNEVPGAKAEPHSNNQGRKQEKGGDVPQQVVSLWQWVSPAALVMFLFLLIIVAIVALTFHLSLARGITALRVEMAEWLYRRDSRERVINHKETCRGYADQRKSAVVV